MTWVVWETENDGSNYIFFVEASSGFEALIVAGHDSVGHMIENGRAGGEHEVTCGDQLGAYNMSTPQGRREFLSNLAFWGEGQQIKLTHRI
jgi:hypothetical protein